MRLRNVLPLLALLAAAPLPVAAPAAAGEMVSHPVALSAACCENFLTRLLYFSQPGNTGVPAYTMVDPTAGMGGFALSEGASFQVVDQEGVTESVTFMAEMFTDIGAATMHEVVHAVNEQLGIALAFEDSGMLMLRGVTGGADSALTLVDGPGAPLAALGFAEETVSGAADIELALATDLMPMGMGDGGGQGAELMHLTYAIVLSTTPGSTDLGHHELPMVVDDVTLLGLRIAQFGLAEGLVGELSHHGTAEAVFPSALLPKMFPQGLPEELYFAFVVFSEAADEIVFVSNRFDLELID